MLAKLSSKNQITQPKAAVSKVAAAGHFDVVVKEGGITLTPGRMQCVGRDARSKPRVSTLNRVLPLVSCFSPIYIFAEK